MSLNSLVFPRFLYIVLLCDTFADCGTRQTFIHHDKTINFQKIQHDSVTGDVYLLDQFNTIYQLDQNLALISESSQASSGPRSHASLAKDETFLLSNNDSRILACSSRSCGFTNLDHSREGWQWHQLSQKNPANIFYNGDTVLTSLHPFEKAFYHVSSGANSTPVLSLRKLTSEGFIWSSYRNYEAYLKMHESQKNLRSITPIFLDTIQRSSKSGFGYLITLQKDLITGQSVSRIGRFCLKNYDLRSYVEVDITCGEAKRGHIATMASLQRFETANSSDRLLFVGFKDDTANATTICSYNLTNVNKVFNGEVQKCDGGPAKGKRSSLSWIDGVPKPCEYFLARSEVCNPFANKNIFINGLESVAVQPLTTEPKKYTSIHVTSVQVDVTKQQNKNKLILLTADSVLALALLDDHMNLDVIAPFRLEPKVYPLLSVKFGGLDLSSPISYLASSEYFVATGHTVEKTVLGCGALQTCSECISAEPLLGCSWCANHCTNARNCLFSELQSNMCPPVVLAITPLNASVGGGTLMHITVEPINLLDSNIRVNLAGVRCTVTSRNHTDIFCKSGSTNSTTNGPVVVNLTSAGTSLINSDLYTFEYLQPEIEAFNPTAGPLWGSTLLTIQGRNFNIGLRQRVLIGELECLIKQINQTRLTCQAAPSSQVKSADVIFLVDDVSACMSKTQFQYQLNPRIYGPLPHIAGNRSIVITGERLDILQQTPFLEFQGWSDVGNQFFKENVTCKVLNATTMICPLDGFHNVATKTITLFLREGFLNDHLGNLSWPIEALSLELQKVITEIPKQPNNSFSYPPFKLQVGSLAAILVGSTTVILILAFLWYHLRFVKRLQWRKQKFTLDSGYGLTITPSYSVEYSSLFIDNSNYGISSIRSMIQSLDLDQCLIAPQQITVERQISGGNFGTVYSGILRSQSDDLFTYTQVAIKVIKDFPTSERLKSFLQEAQVMKHFDHENVMTLIGICIFETDGTNASPQLILPFMSGGDLHSYVVNAENIFGIEEVISCGAQIARGMSYLAQLQFVHRDLAARNCMLSDKLQVKVADFGLSRDIYEESKYTPTIGSESKLPIRWMAPECLDINRQSFSSQSDVWSFGVILWELLTRGAKPYGAIPVYELRNFFVEGYRLEIPDSCPESLRIIANSCWHINPDFRPTFPMLETSLTSSDLLGYLNVGYLNSHFALETVTHL